MKNFVPLLIFLLLIEKGYCQLLPSTNRQIYNFCVGDSFEYSYNETEAPPGCGIVGVKLDIITGYSTLGDSIYYSYTELSSLNHQVCPNYFPPYGVLFDSVAVSKTVANADSSIFGAVAYGTFSCGGSGTLCYDSTYAATTGIFSGRTINESNNNDFSELDNIWIDSLGLVYSNLYLEGMFTPDITQLIYYHKSCGGQSWGSFQSFPNYSQYLGIDNLQASSAVQISPNPVNGNFQVLLSNPLPVSTFCVTNILGQKVYKEEAIYTKTMVDCSNWITGIYIYSLSHNGEIVTCGKLIVR